MEYLIWLEMYQNGLMIGLPMIIMNTPPRKTQPDQNPEIFMFPEVVLGVMWNISFMSGPAGFLLLTFSILTADFDAVLPRKLVPIPVRKLWSLTSAVLRTGIIQAQGLIPLPGVLTGHHHCPLLYLQKV